MSQEINTISLPQTGLHDDKIGFHSHSDSVFSIDISQDGSNIISGGAEEVCILWGIEHALGEVGCEPFKRLTGHTDSIISTRFNYDDSLVVTASMDGTLKVYKSDTGENTKTLEGPGAEINWLQVHKSKNIVCCGSADSTCWVFSLDSDDDGFVSAFARHLRPVTCGDFLEDNVGVVSCSEDGEIFIWKYKTGETILKIPSVMSQINCVSVSQNSFAVGTFDKGVMLFSPKDGRKFMSLHDYDQSYEAVGICNSGMLLYAGGLDNFLLVWDISTKRLRGKIDLKSMVLVIYAMKTKPILVCGLESGQVVLVDYRSAEAIKVFEGHKERVLSISCPRDESVIATAGDDGSCFLFALE